jgi:hypothetical protein
MQTAPIKSARPVLKSATIRDFTGGLNLLDDDLNLSTKYSKVLTNMVIGADAAPAVRYGTSLFSNLSMHTSSVGAYPVNIEYYNAAVIAVMSNGDVLSVLGDGSIDRIWDATIAAALPGAPDGWSATEFASFAQFNGELIICNGVDKPLIVFSDLSVDYLQDLATTSNLNTPICKYVTVCDRYLVMAGDPVNVNRIHISSKDTSGTWYGDAPPNDGTYIDVGSILANASFIRGIATFKGKLVIGYAEGTILGDLGIYESTDHVPEFNETADQYGTVSHRSMLSYGDDMLMLDLVGIPSLKRTVFAGTIKPERVSDLVDPEIASLLNVLSFDSLENRCFGVYNQKEGQFLFFIPNTDSLSTTTETIAYSFIYRPSLNVARWSRVSGWNFTCACRTIQGNVIFGDKNGKLWLLGNDDAKVYSDYYGDSTINSGLGNPVIFYWELPWSDVNKRLRIKNTKHIAFDTRGTNDFTVSMFVDRFIYDEDLAEIPLLSMTMVGGDSPEFGEGLGAYGGGRNTADNKQYAWPAKFNQMKLRIRGSATEPLSFISISITYQDGSFYR